jgi:hypothetical protein
LTSYVVGSTALTRCGPLPRHHLRGCPRPRSYPKHSINQPAKLKQPTNQPHPQGRYRETYSIEGPQGYNPARSACYKEFNERKNSDASPLSLRNNKNLSRLVSMLMVHQVHDCAPIRPPTLGRPLAVKPPHNLLSTKRAIHSTALPSSESPATLPSHTLPCRPPGGIHGTAETPSL